MTEPAPPRASRRADLLAIVFVVVAVGLAGWALRDQLPDVVDSVGRIAWWRMPLALAAIVLGLLATAEVWKHCLAALVPRAGNQAHISPAQLPAGGVAGPPKYNTGTRANRRLASENLDPPIYAPHFRRGAPGSRVSSNAARQIFFPAQVGKYLPGSVWPFLAQVRFAREHGVPGGLALLAGSVFLVVHAVTSVLVGALLLISQPALVSKFGWAGVCIPLALVLLHPKVINLLARKLAGRSGVEPPVLRWSHLVAPIAWMFPAWLGYGLASYLLADPFTDSVLTLALVCTASFALGWIVGLVVFIAPAGVGAREAVLVLALTPLLGVAAATTVSLLLRVGHTVADMLLALRYGLVRARRRDRAELGAASANPHQTRSASS